jgi:hypothetical protein
MAVTHDCRGGASNAKVPEKFKDLGSRRKTSPPVSGRSFFEELNRRRVYRVALGCAVVASATVQVAGTVLPIFHVPEWLQQIVVVLIAIGFPCALMLAWAFDVTSEGVQRTSNVRGVGVSSNLRQIWALGMLSTLIAALALSAYWFWHPWAHPITALSRLHRLVRRERYTNTILPITPPFPSNSCACLASARGNRCAISGLIFCC